MLDSESDRYRGIAQMLRAGETLDIIKEQWKCGYRTITRIREAEGIKPGVAGPRPFKPGHGDTDHVKQLRCDQLWKCPVCECNLPLVCKPVRGPDRPGAVMLTCHACYRLMSLLDWRIDVMKNLGRLAEKYGDRAGNDAEATGSKYKNQDGPDVMQDKTGYFVTFPPDEKRVYVEERHLWWPGD